MGVVSASHDHSLRVWTFSGECIAQLLGHTALVYAAAVSPTGLIASASEDNTLRLWRPDGTLLQTIHHPGENASYAAGLCEKRFEVEDWPPLYFAVRCVLSCCHAMQTLCQLLGLPPRSCAAVMQVACGT